LGSEPADVFDGHLNRRLILQIAEQRGGVDLARLVAGLSLRIRLRGNIARLAVHLSDPFLTQPKEAFARDLMTLFWRASRRPGIVQLCGQLPGCAWRTPAR
jgi:hypothetical protein